MRAEPFVVENIYNAPVGKIWQALTNKDQMKQWYFDIAIFKLEVGSEFQFVGGTEENSYLHLSKITEVVAQEKLSYSWRYNGYAGNSLVTFEFFAEGDKTRLKLTHAGLETFPEDNPGFARENFVQGWHYILGTSLADFVQNT